MGRGPNPNLDPPMSKAKNLRAEVAEVELGGSSAGVAELDQSPCEAEQTITISLSAPVQPGAPIEIRLASPPRVLSSGLTIGFVVGKSAKTVRGCLTHGYALTGDIREVSPDNRSATAVIVGRKKPSKGEEDDL